MYEKKYAQIFSDLICNFLFKQIYDLKVYIYIFMLETNMLKSDLFAFSLHTIEIISLLLRIFKSK